MAVMPQFWTTGSEALGALEHSDLVRGFKACTQGVSETETILALLKVVPLIFYTIES